MSVFKDIKAETDRHIELWGVQSHPDGTDSWAFTDKANNAKILYDYLAKHYPEKITWRDILLEEVFEALSEDRHQDKLREELVQVAAVCCSWIMDIDMRKIDGD